MAISSQLEPRCRIGGSPKADRRELDSIVFARETRAVEFTRRGR
jgi:hypothetical protein